ncbi:hypothetical protein MBM_04574 [Drepanopeziza brunnea f. sp. 'multigermtubi' MB_m1]|uniref:Uncharacterized protein n=1 Tax=Marssonina brunnea f. sp. multigermtubi (strain MB_m1) TaxID=1072389 RepID=K1WWS7_MARBU|nr:uncharacterized protein MBM_04574 [Drepanopeziza brunnea f. sp. 'multigermtubi' MB_m1]EKD16997.1 hypothetical protein MBM_04574 [Drepanopeziza brunnea f. sp. 'multigermtubi' MB_m1]
MAHQQLETSCWWTTTVSLSVPRLGPEGQDQSQSRLAPGTQAQAGPCCTHLPRIIEKLYSRPPAFGQERELAQKPTSSLQKQGGNGKKHALGTRYCGKLGWYGPLRSRRLTLLDSAMDLLEGTDGMLGDGLPCKAHAVQSAGTSPACRMDPSCCIAYCPFAFCWMAFKCQAATRQVVAQPGRVGWSARIALPCPAREIQDSTRIFHSKDLFGHRDQRNRKRHALAPRRDVSSWPDLQVGKESPAGRQNVLLPTTSTWRLLQADSLQSDLPLQADLPTMPRLNDGEEGIDSSAVEKYAKWPPPLMKEI